MSEVEEVEAKVWRRGAGWLALEATRASGEVAPRAPVAAPAGEPTRSPVPAPAAGVGAVVRAFRDFSDDDLAAAHDALAAIDETATKDLMVARHLGRAQDGRFLIGLRVPRHPLSIENRDKPWDEYVMGTYVGFMYDQTWFELGDGIELLRSDDCPEAEARRRDNLQAERSAQGQAAIERERAARQEEDLRREEQVRARQARGIEDWQKLHAWQRLAHRLAALFRERDPKLASEISAIANDVYSQTGTAGNPQHGPGLPDVEWRR